MTNEQSSELAEPGVGSFDDPAAFVAVQLAAIFIAPVPAVSSVGHDQLHAAFLQPLAQWVRVIGAVSDHPFRLLPGPAFGPGDADLCERGFRKRSLTRRGTFQSNSQWKTRAVDQYHPLRSPCRAWFLPTAAPPFSPERSCRPESSLPTSAGPCRRARPATLATHRARRPPLPTASDDASKWPGTGISLAETATLLLFAAPRESPPDTPGLRPMDGRDYPSASSALATAVRLTSTAHRSTE
jgi:hypothetical protein